MWSDLIHCIESDADIKYKLFFLNTLINVHGINLENENEINQVKSKIKDFCADATQRTGGLLLLYAVVHCSSTIYVDNWSQIVLGSIKIPDSLIPREIPLKVVNRMLINFGNDSDYSDVFSRLIPEILPVLLDPGDDKIYKLSCQCLAVCMKCVPKITGTRAADIENLLLKQMHNPYGEIVEAIGECFAALPMCVLHLQREVSIEYKDIWCNLFEKCLNTMHLLLNSIMKQKKDKPEFADASSSPVFEISFTSEDLPLTQIDVFKSLCQCLAKMMSSDSPRVLLPITKLLNTLYRTFEVVDIIKRRSQDPRTAYLKLGFSQMLNGLYVVLEALILNFGILDQNYNFLNIMKRSLSAMKETSFSESSVSQVRGSTWKLIDVWMKKHLSAGSSALARDKTILQEILEDIDIPKKDITRTNLLKGSDYEKNQKANRIYACIHALKVLKNLLETSSCYMEKNHLDEICSTLLRISKIVVRHISPIVPYPVPYSDEKCRKMLFDVLLCCAIYSDSIHSKCIVEAQNVFSIAFKDTNLKVRRICHRFRKLSRYYLNPRKPPPDAVKYSHQNMLKQDEQPIIESVRSEWGNGIEWNNADVPLSDDEMEEGEVAQVEEGDAYSDKMENEGGMMTVEQINEDGPHMNHDYRRIVKQSSHSMGEEDSADDSDIEPTYVSTVSNPQRMSMNDSSHMNSFGMPPCVEQYANETRTQRRASEEVVPNLRNNVENNIEEHVSAFVEVKSAAQKPPQVPMGNGEWKKKENPSDSEDDDSDMEEEGDEEGEAKDEGDEEGEANEEVSDNAADEASDGKRSPGFEDERPRKRQKCQDEEGDDDGDEEVEEEEIPVNQSSDEEEGEVINVPAVEQNAGSHSENLVGEESQDGVEDADCSSPTIREMCGDFVLVEPATTEIS